MQGPPYRNLAFIYRLVMLTFFLKQQSPGIIDSRTFPYNYCLYRFYSMPHALFPGLSCGVIGIYTFDTSVTFSTSLPIS